MKISARGIIVHEEKILLVRHKNRDFFALPGGTIDHNEDIKSALKRELHEELGVDAKIGNMLRINEFAYPDKNLSVEFFFWILNGEDFTGELKGEHTEAELEEIEWHHISEGIHMRPEFLIPELPSLNNDSTFRYVSRI